MKYLLIISLFALFFPTAYAQNNIGLSQTFRPNYVVSKDIRLQNSYVFTPITENELFNKSFFMAPNDEAGPTSGHGVDKTPNLLSMPGYAMQPGAMMSTVNMYSSIGNLKFYCNYYFDDEGQLQDGEITITTGKK